MRPVVMKEGRRAEHNPEQNRLNLKILFPKPNGGKATGGQIVLINGDVPQVKVRAPDGVEVYYERVEEGINRDNKKGGDDQ